MGRLFKDDPALIIVFGGGTLFVILAVVLVGMLLSKSPQVESVAIAAKMDEISTPPSSEIDLGFTQIGPNLEPGRLAPQPTTETFQTPVPASKKLSPMPASAPIGPTAGWLWGGNLLIVAVFSQKSLT